MPGGSTQFDDRQRVLDATDIVQVVGEHVKLHAKGREFVGLCPFHDDHKPSMFVVPMKQIYHCFSCGAGGNSLDFVINFHKLEFREALQFLADRANIELTPHKRAENAPQPARSATRADLLAANAFANDFFRLLLKHPEKGAIGRAEIEKRGFTPETAERFQLGLAADAWDALVATAAKRKFSPRLLIEAGLARPPKEGQSSGYDVFRNRLIFPIHDQLGRPIAFGGRKLRDEDEPKYLNSPESLLFDKSSTLYGLHLAAKPIQRDGRAIITEGYTDVIACHQAGFENVVATLGTALTPRHARVLQRLCKTIVLIFDGDEAGAKAADRAIEVFFSQPVDVKIAVLPSGNDPADLLNLPDGAARFREAIDHAADALDYRLSRLRARLVGAGLSQRAQLIQDEVDRLVELGLDRQPIVRWQMIVRRIAALAGVQESAIQEAIVQANNRIQGRAARHHQSDAADQSPINRTPALDAFGCLFCEPPLSMSLSVDDRDIFATDAYPPGPLRQIASAAAMLEHESDTITTANALDRIEHPDARRIAAGIVSVILQETGGDGARLAAHFRTCVQRALLEMQSRKNSVATPINEASPDTTSTESVLERIHARRRLIERFGQDHLAHANASEPTPAAG